MSAILSRPIEGATLRSSVPAAHIAECLDVRMRDRYREGTRLCFADRLSNGKNSSEK